MCPPHCGDYLDDDRALLHWPAPNLEASRAACFGFVILTVAIACAGIALSGYAAARQLGSAGRRRRLDLDLATCRAMVCTVLVLGLVPSVLAAWAAWAVSFEWMPLRICGDSTSSDGATLLASLAGVALPLVVHRRMVCTAKLEARIDVEIDLTAAYRTAPVKTVRFADPARAERAALSAFALRLALAAGVVLALVQAQTFWRGVPNTIRLFEIGLLAVGLAVMNWPTTRAVMRPFEARLRLRLRNS